MPKPRKPKPPKPQVPEKVFDQDQWGNKIILKDNKIYLHLTKGGYKRYRKIFTIDLPHKRLIAERDYNMHRFVKNNSYAFCSMILQKVKACTHILLKEVRYEQIFHYLIPIPDIKKYGTYLHIMKNDNYELQVFMNLEFLENNYKIIEEEAKI